MAKAELENQAQVKEVKMLYVDNQEIARTFQIPVSTVDYLRRKGKLPSLKVGKHNRYDLKEVEKALRGRNSN
jgi:hypothetical protein